MTEKRIDSKLSRIMPGTLGLSLSSLVLACVAFSLMGVAFGQQPGDAASQPQAPKATVVDGHPALALDYGDGVGFLIVYGTLHDKPAFRFSVSHLAMAGLHHRECGGFLWVSQDEVSYLSDPAADKQCVSSHIHINNTVNQFDVPRSAVTSAVHVDYVSFFSLKPASKHSDMRDGFDAVFAFKAVPGDKPLIDRDLTARLTDAQRKAFHWLEIVLNNFDDAKQQFAQATAGVPFPLSPNQDAGIAAAEKSGEAAEQAGNARQAFDTYVAALTGLPPGASGDAVDSLRESLIRVAAKLNPPPPVPEEAKRHLAYALAAIEEGKTSGDASKLNDAVNQLSQVLRDAPWRPEAYYNLGMVLEQQKQYGEAARNLKLYLMAAPNAQDAEAVQQKIYQLEYKAGAR